MQIAINHTVRPLIVAKPLPSKSNIPQYEAVRLMPGTNEIDEATVDVINGSATARHWLEKKWLELPKASKESSGEGLDGFEPSAALEFIAECMDTATLDRWSEVEKRKDVKTAIKKRQRELERALAREPKEDQA